MRLTQNLRVLTLILTLIFGVEISNAQLPKPAQCAPGTLNNCCSAGIHRVRLNTIDNDAPSKNGNVGYEDLTTLFSTKLTLGTTYMMEVWTNPLVEENVRAWIDFNNDGIFDTINELIFKSDTVLEYHQQIITVPGSAVEDSALRLRVASDFLGVHVNPCRDLHVGQAEDYTITLVSGFQPPVAAFTADKELSCDGVVQFIDRSANAPITWFWDFGDNKISTFQHPQHVYTKAGTYDVTLTVTNAQGNHDITYNSYVTVKLGNSPAAPLCKPGTQSNNCLGYGIFNVRLEDINHPSGCGKEGYKDYSCEAQTDLLEGKTYTIYVEVNSALAQDTKVWFDLNSDGDFDDERELVFAKDNILGQVQGNIRIPSNTTIVGSVIRMRVMSDITGNGPSMISCFPPEFGQVEDYGIHVKENTLPPIAEFVSYDRKTCTGAVQFYELAENVPSSYLWDFGDGTFSSLRDPLHYYLLQDTYTVTLEVSNTFGSDHIPKFFYIEMDTICDNNMPFAGFDISHECSGQLYDYGGPFNDYSALSSGKFIIEPYNATQLTVTFKSMSIETGKDYIRIWEGDISDNNPFTPPLSGTSFPGPMIIPSGKITIEFSSGELIEGSGFELEWTCEGPPYSDMAWDPSRSDVCEGQYQFINLSKRATSYTWSYNGSDQNNDKHSVFEIDSSNKAEAIDVELVATNALGSDTSYLFDVPVSRLFPDFETESFGNLVTCKDLSVFNPEKWFWEFGDGDTSDIQNPSHNYIGSHTGPITLTVSNQHCSNTISKNINSIYERTQDIENQLIVHPNPSSNYFQVLVKNKKIHYISVLNTVGKTMLSRDFSDSDEIIINIENFESGLYIVIAQTNDEILTTKLIVTNINN